jgi:hypothetical protein
MSIRKTFIAALAIAIATASSPLHELKAATFNLGSVAGSESLVQSIKVKKSGKKARSARGGKSCGAFMYRKGGKCLDARTK